MPKVRLAIPRELDCRPLVWSFLKGHHQGLFQPVEYPTERILPLLDQGELEVGLVPAIDFVRREAAHAGLDGVTGQRIELDVVGDLCTAATAEALVLYSHVPIERIERVDFAQASPTSAQLAKIILRQGLEREVSSGDWNFGVDLSEADALLISSDTLLRDDLPEDLEVIDLVELWKESTGLPVVLYLWVYSPRSTTLPDLEFYLKSSLRYGLSSLETISRELAAEGGLQKSRVSSYLSNSLSYVLGEAERRGLAELRRRCECLESAEPVSL